MSRLETIIILVSLSAPGIHCTYENICEEFMSCEGGNKEDVNACVIAFEYSEELAHLTGCEEEWDTYIDCLEKNGHCSNETWNDDKCSEKENDFNQCAW